MKKIFTTVIAAMWSFVALSAQQQAEMPGKLSLTLEQAQQYAVEHNRTLKNASLDVQKAQAVKWQSIASMLPQVKASVDYSNMLGYKMNLGQMQISMPASATMGVSTSMALNGAMVVGVQIAEISKKMSDINLMKTERDIRNQVKTLYCSALVTGETLELLKENHKSMKKLYEISQNSVNVGVSEQTSADQLKIQVAQMENVINSTSQTLEMVYNMLRLQLTVDEDTDIELTQKIDDIISLGAVADLMAEEFNIENNYDYMLLKKSTDMAKKQIALNGWTNGPTISVFHQYNYKHYFSDEATFNSTPPNMVGASLSIPIFTSLKATSSVKEAKLSYAKQLNTLADTELALYTQHRQLVFNLKTAIDSYALQKQSVTVSKSVLDNISKKYEFGVSSALEVTNASTNFVTAQSNYIQSVIQVVNDQISLEELLNK